MAEGISPALPLRIDPIDGAYGLNKNLKQVAEQGLRMVILTSPGERIMFPQFGVGVRSYLFEQNTSSTTSRIRTAIESQVATYLPYIKIESLTVRSPEVINSANPGEVDNTTILIELTYSIPAARITSSLTVPVSLSNTNY
tara:strand:+ start:885 stop:1307 length:423 start_codon:yes stop_codon:yes gene_type:complete